MQIGVLTGGGDCPGLNAVIRAVVRKGVEIHGHAFVGFRDGWRGPLEGDVVPLDVSRVRGILPRGGTILGSSRTNPYNYDDGERRVLETMERFTGEVRPKLGRAVVERSRRKEPVAPRRRRAR